jgi:hypothetical protein
MSTIARTFAWPSGAEDCGGAVGVLGAAVTAWSATSWFARKPETRFAPQPSTLPAARGEWEREADQWKEGLARAKAIVTVARFEAMQAVVAL